MLVLLLGLIVGSFLGAVTYRIPKGVGFVKGRSFCPKCKKNIFWFDNIPLFSYIFLFGKCRNCNKRISLRYSLIEVTTSVLFVLTYIAFFGKSSLFYCGLVGSTYFSILSFVLLLIFISSLVCVFVVDLESQIIPDELTFFSFVAALLFLVSVSNFNFYTNILSSFTSSLFLLILYFITCGKGMGLGDVKFALVGGLLFGFLGAINWFFVAFLTGAMVGIILILVKKAKLKAKIAFGPFLVFSMVAQIFFGPILIKWLQII